MLLAEGGVDIACEPELALHDMAACAIIVTEAGGQFTDLDGRRARWATGGYATNGRLHDAVLAQLALDDDGHDDDARMIMIKESARRPEPDQDVEHRHRSHLRCAARRWSRPSRRWTEGAAGRSGRYVVAAALDRGATRGRLRRCDRGARLRGRTLREICWRAQPLPQTRSSPPLMARTGNEAWPARCTAVWLLRGSSNAEPYWCTWSTCLT